ncbi:AMP-binding protein [Neobacillus mesonae]|uniref:AMP-binding protein n=1 Tax=Neobacillus mesonae TaxID=1193713 RepID=UPI00203B70F9|nr:AMP-binding protein [Neobacillus mesonae]MCM3566941.1 AMP-binding protein [Neobacillus mesonae]
MVLNQTDFYKVKETWAISTILSKQAMERPNSPALQWEDEIPITYNELYLHCLKLSGGLSKLGVKKNDKVLILLPNSLEVIYTWISVNFLGAIEVPINIHYKGSFLVHETNDSQARVAVVHEQYLSRFYEVSNQLKHIEDIIVVGEGEVEFKNNEQSKWHIHNWEKITNSEPISGPVKAKYSDIAAIMYTSGTTGPSKGVIMPYGLEGSFAQAIIDIAHLSSDDVYYVCLPLFHANAQFMQVLPAFIVGARVSVWPGFSASGWLDQIRKIGATVTNTLGVMCEFIYRQPRRQDDSINPLRCIFSLPTPKDIAEDFEKRFSVTCIEGYGMTESTVVTYRRLNEPLKLGSAGRALDWYEVSIVDPETDELMPPDGIGEIVIRPKYPWTFMKGYHNAPSKTIEAWRNLWFHTGDSGKMDENGYLYFVDRIKDSIRRRGENITSQSIENVLNSHPKIKESAAIAIKSEYGAGGEDEVKICVVLKPNEIFSYQDLHKYCEENMPYFAVPRYIEYVDELPKTPNQKLRKNVLREQGITAKTWDREAAGIKVRK